ncbi:MAG: hypothetical protein JRJ87_27515, partial [Deltaproteobacteria bacterium]|nr:hypothetical protein [Deltaproteobacteria bacterium]
YRRFFDDIDADIELGFGWASYKKASFETKEAIVDLRTRVGWRLELGPTAFGICFGPVLRLFIQNRERTDQDRLSQAGLAIATSSKTVALFPGGNTEVSWSLFLGDRIVLRLAGWVSIFAMKVAETDGTVWQAVPVLGASGGFGFRF